MSNTTKWEHRTDAWTQMGKTQRHHALRVEDVETCNEDDDTLMGDISMATSMPTYHA